MMDELSPICSPSSIASGDTKHNYLEMSGSMHLDTLENLNLDKLHFDTQDLMKSSYEESFEPSNSRSVRRDDRDSQSKTDIQGGNDLRVTILGKNVIFENQTPMRRLLHAIKFQISNGTPSDDTLSSERTNLTSDGSPKLETTSQMSSKQRNIIQYAEFDPDLSLNDKGSGSDLLDQDEENRRPETEEEILEDGRKRIVYEYYDRQDSRSGTDYFDGEDLPEDSSFSNRVNQTDSKTSFSEVDLTGNISEEASGHQIDMEVIRDFPQPNNSSEITSPEKFGESKQNCYIITEESEISRESESINWDKMKNYQFTQYGEMTAEATRQTSGSIAGGISNAIGSSSNSSSTLKVKATENKVQSPSPGQDGSSKKMGSGKKFNLEVVTDDLNEEPEGEEREPEETPHSEQSRQEGTGTQAISDETVGTHETEGSQNIVHTTGSISSSASGSGGKLTPSHEQRAHSMPTKGFPNPATGKIRSSSKIPLKDIKNGPGGTFPQRPGGGKGGRPINIVSPRHVTNNFNFNIQSPNVKNAGTPMVFSATTPGSTSSQGGGAHPCNGSQGSFSATGNMQTNENSKSQNSSGLVHHSKSADSSFKLKGSEQIHQFEKLKNLAFYPHKDLKFLTEMDLSTPNEQIEALQCLVEMSYRERMELAKIVDNMKSGGEKQKKAATDEQRGIDAMWKEMASMREKMETLQTNQEQESRKQREGQESLQGEVRDLHDKVFNLRNENDVLKKDVRMLNKEISHQRDLFDDLKEDLMKYKSLCASRASENDALTQELTKVRREVRDNRQEVESYKNQMVNLEQVHRRSEETLHTVVQEFSVELKRLEEDKLNCSQKTSGSSSGNVVELAEAFARLDDELKFVINYINELNVDKLIDSKVQGIREDMYPHLVNEIHSFMQELKQVQMDTLQGSDQISDHPGSWGSRKSLGESESMEQNFNTSITDDEFKSRSKDRREKRSRGSKGSFDHPRPPKSHQSSTANISLSGVGTGKAMITDSKSKERSPGSVVFHNEFVRSLQKDSTQGKSRRSHKRSEKKSSTQNKTLNSNNVHEFCEKLIDKIVKKKRSLNGKGHHESRSLDAWEAMNGAGGQEDLSNRASALVYDSNKDSMTETFANESFKHKHVTPFFKDAQDYSGETSSERISTSFRKGSGFLNRDTSSDFKSNHEKSKTLVIDGKSNFLKDYRSYSPTNEEGHPSEATSLMGSQKMDMGKYGAWTRKKVHDPGLQTWSPSSMRRIFQDEHRRKELHSLHSNTNLSSHSGNSDKSLSIYRGHDLSGVSSSRHGETIGHDLSSRVSPRRQSSLLFHNRALKSETASSSSSLTTGPSTNAAFRSSSLQNTIDREEKERPKGATLMTSGSNDLSQKLQGKAFSLNASPVAKLSVQDGVARYFNISKAGRMTTGMSTMASSAHSLEIAKQRMKRELANFDHQKESNFLKKLIHRNQA